MSITIATIKRPSIDVPFFFELKLPQLELFTEEWVESAKNGDILRRDLYVTKDKLVCINVIEYKSESAYLSFIERTAQFDYIGILQRYCEAYDHELKIIHYKG